MTQTSAAPQRSEQADAIRPFRINFREEDFTELRRRINATKWQAGQRRALCGLGATGTPGQRREGGV